jgi:hypothetical protein
VQILRLGLDTPSVPTISACACLVVQFLWFARADTCIHLRDGHVGIGEFGVTLTERTKTISRHLSSPVTRPFHAGWDPDGLVLRLLRSWLRVRGPVSQDAYFWAIPGETLASAWTSALINGWLQEILSVLGVTTPLGCAWTSHSLRSGGASAAFALGVELLVIIIIMNWGLWSTLDLLHLYIDVLVQSDEVEALFFGHLLREPWPPPRG